jgi:hypothetical protein
MRAKQNCAQKGFFFMLLTLDWTCRFNALENFSPLDDVRLSIRFYFATLSIDVQNDFFLAFNANSIVRSFVFQKLISMTSKSQHRNKKNAQLDAVGCCFELKQLITFNGLLFRASNEIFAFWLTSTLLPRMQLHTISAFFHQSFSNCPSHINVWPCKQDL